MTRLTPRPAGFLPLLGFLLGVLVCVIIALVTKPAAWYLLFAAVLVGNIRQLFGGVYADDDKLLIRSGRRALAVGWQEIEGFVTRPNRANPWGPPTTETLWVELRNGERYPMPIGIRRMGERASLQPSISDAAMAELRAKLEGFRRGAAGPPTVTSSTRPQLIIPPKRRSVTVRVWR
jgi:hypothetical protein